MKILSHNSGLNIQAMMRRSGPHILLVALLETMEVTITE